MTLSVITFLDRLCISVAGPRMQRELGLSPEQWGWVLGAFILCELQTGSVATVAGGGKRDLGEAPQDKNKDWAILVRKVAGRN